MLTSERVFERNFVYDQALHVLLDTLVTSDNALAVERARGLAMGVATMLRDPEAVMDPEQARAVADQIQADLTVMADVELARMEDPTAQCRCLWCERISS